MYPYSINAGTTWKMGKTIVLNGDTNAGFKIDLFGQVKMGVQQKKKLGTGVAV